MTEISERDFAKQLQELFKKLGWKYYHVLEQRKYAKRTSSGFPDYVLAKNGRVIFAEIKGSTGKVTDAQWEWIKLLSENTGIEVYIWRPDDFETEIAEVLSRE